MTRPHSAEEYQDTAMFSSLTAQYRSEVYCVLATKGLALMLRACVPVCGDSFMVVAGPCPRGDGLARSQPSKAPSIRHLQEHPRSVALFHPNNLVFVTPGGSSSDARCRGTDRCKGRVCAFLSPVSPRNKIADAARPSPPAPTTISTVDRPRQVV
ncbi:hypothetical protein BC826DRAFT_1015133 [Russula brevipes]|nr:hypothetical protein BC826DRAFT_1015133 [Russula brevipes]